MANENIDMSKNFEETNLAYKDHQRFFDDYYDFKKLFNKYLLGATFDYSLVEEAYISLFQFINNAIAQITLVKDKNELNKAKTKITNLIVNKKQSEALDEMEKLFQEVCDICMLLELEPKPENKQDSEEVKFWKEETHKGLREIKKGFMDVLSIKNG